MMVLMMLKGSNTQRSQIRVQAGHENKLRSAFQFVRVQKERQNLPDDKRLHKRARNIRKNKAFKAKLLGRKCKEDKPSIPGLVIDAVVKKNIDYNLAQLSDTEVKCIQYGNTSYTSYKMKAH